MSVKTPELDDTVAADGETPAGVSRVPAPPDSLGAISSSTPSGHQVVAGRYEILALLGVGGMGAVYRAKDRRLDEHVALKMLRGEHVATPTMQRRFHDEVKLARKVTHRNVARTFDIGDHEGTLFLTMELLHGEPLGMRIERDGALAINHAVDVALDVASGLDAAHAAGVVHRDLKPDNVFLTTDGRAVVTDFGIARASSADEAGKTGGIIGTPAYMAPEQLEGRADIDGRTDLYALGEVLYEMLTGVRAWPAPDPMASLAQRLVQPPPDPCDANGDVSPALAAIVTKLLAKKPEDRFPTAADVGKALTAAKSSAKPSVRPIEKVALPKADARGEKTVAVLPFKGQGAPDWVPQGLLEDLIDTLSMTRGLRVRPVGVVEPYASTQLTAREVGRELGVSVVVEGSIRAVGSDLRLSTRAIGVDDGFQIWAQRWQKPAGQILEVSDEAAKAIASALTGSLNVPERGAQDPLAAEMYLRARGELRAAYHARERMKKMATLFDAALALAPQDPHVLSGAAVAHARIAFFSHGAELTAARDRAQAFADRAIALAPNLGEPWVAVATLRNYDGDFAGAGRALMSAMRVAPNTAKARELLGRLLLEIGDLDDGIELLQGALELDPSCIDPRWDLARGLALRGEVERARELLDRPVTDSSLAQRAWMRGRLVMWFPDERSKALVLSEHVPDTGIVSRAFTSVQRLLSKGKIDDFDRPYFDGNIAHGSKRIRLLARQAYAEFMGFGGEGAVAVLEHVRAAVEDDLLDLAWIDRCPLLAEARKDASWPELRKKVAERASRVRAAIHE